MLFRVSTCRIRLEYLTRYSANINSGFSCKLDRLGQLCRCVQTSQQRAVGVARGSLRLAREASADASLGPEKVGKFRRSKKPSGQARERERSELKFRVARKKEPSGSYPSPPLEARRSRAGVLWARQRRSAPELIRSPLSTATLATATRTTQIAHRIGAPRKTRTRTLSIKSSRDQPGPRAGVARLSLLALASRRSALPRAAPLPRCPDRSRVAPIRAPAGCPAAPTARVRARRRPTAGRSNERPAGRRHGRDRREEGREDRQAGRRGLDAGPRARGARGRGRDAAPAASARRVQLDAAPRRPARLLDGRVLPAPRRRRAGRAQGGAPRRRRRALPFGGVDAPRGRALARPRPREPLRARGAVRSAPLRAVRARGERVPGRAESYRAAPARTPGRCRAGRSRPSSTRATQGSSASARRRCSRTGGGRAPGSSAPTGSSRCRASGRDASARGPRPGPRTSSWAGPTPCCGRPAAGVT